MEDGRREGNGREGKRKERSDEVHLACVITLITHHQLRMHVSYVQRYAILDTYQSLEHGFSWVSCWERVLQCTPVDFWISGDSVRYGCHLRCRKVEGWRLLLMLRQRRTFGVSRLGIRKDRRSKIDGVYVNECRIKYRFRLN